MSLATIASRALDGLEAPAVQVEVHLANGLPSFTLVGLADTEVKEARERVRAALATSGFAFPHNKRITVSLAPADLPKESSRFDLPIALGILAADGQLDAARLARCEFAGELSLAGELRPVRGALALALALRREQPARTLVLPRASAREAALATGLTVRCADHLLDVVRAMVPGDGPGALADDGDSDSAGDHAGRRANRQASTRTDHPAADAAAAMLPLAEPLALARAAAPPDLRDVKGQGAAKRALEIAAAGSHSMLMVGPPGSGKSMLAQRLPALLPPLSEDEALASAALQGLSPRGFDAAGWGQRPVRAPHHSASAVALVGGGSPPRPGEISLAHGGVLFLDELPEFARATLEALREPLESGRITISRAARQAVFPARFQLVAAMNPCPCGWLGAPAGAGARCRCTPDQVNRYQSRISGPLLDRIDLQVPVHAAVPGALLAHADGEATASVAARVAQARTRQLQRQGRVNAELEPGEIDRHCPLDAAGRQFVETAAQRLGWSGRSLHRVLKLARTIADLAAAPSIDTPHLAEAMQLRRGLPSA